MTRLHLLAVFAGLYFVQGLLDPDNGLLRQPVRQQLEDAGLGAGAIGGALAVAALPWIFKPLYGLWFDCVPLWGERRRSWLTLSAIAALVATLGLTLATPGPGAPLVAALLVITLAVACGDVLADALMVEVGQARGLTGQIQSVQWTAAYAAAILAGALGGRLSGRLALAAGVCAAAAAACLVLTRAAVAEPPRTDLSPGTDGIRGGLRALLIAAASPALTVPLGFLVLVSFVPFYGTVLDLHFTGALGVSEADYGDTLAIQAFGCMLASALYGLYCRKVRLLPLIHASIALGIAAQLAYLAARDAGSLAVASFFTGLAYMTSTIVQLDLAARVCPPRIAAAMFALLMAASNLSLTLATWLGGHAYERLAATRGPAVGFTAVVLAGCAITAACWLLVPALRRVLTAR